MLDFDPGSIELRSGHFIGGKIVQGGKQLIEVSRPSDGERYVDIPLGTADDVDRAVSDAHTAFRTSGWATMPPRDRARILRRWAELIEADRTDLARVEAIGSTRPISESTNWDVSFVAEGIRFFAEFADKLGGEVISTRTDNLGLVVAQPYGVVAAITPWNVPIVNVSWKAGPALAAGNAIVLKPSELTPISVLRLAELAIEAGVPPGIFNVVQGNGVVTGSALCRHPLVSKITFTGSGRSGAAVMAAAAESGTKPVTLELGGKNPQLVFKDAPDVEKAATAIARSMLGNAGQVCVAGSRLIAHESIAFELIEKIAKVCATVNPGPTWKGSSTFSPIISVKQADRIDAIVHDATRNGAKAVIGGGRNPRIQGGAFYEPTILTDVTPEMDAVKEEIFGPVLTVETFHDDQEGISKAEHPVYGLSAGIYTANISKAMSAMRTLEAGTVWINRYGRTNDFMVPTGGFKQSGIGKDLGRQAVEQNLRHKSVLIDL